MSFSILSTNFTYPVFSRSVAARPEKKQQKHHKCVPRNTPNSDKIHTRKTYEFWHRVWHEFDFKNDPKMIQKSATIAPLGSQGPTWDPLGEPGAPPGAS